MRITVGHVLMTMMSGGAACYFYIHSMSPNVVPDSSKSMLPDMEAIMGFFKSEEGPKKDFDEKPLVPVDSTSTDSNLVQDHSVDIKALAPVVPVAPPVTQAVPVAQPERVAAVPQISNTATQSAVSPVKKSTTRRVRRTRRSSVKAATVERGKSGEIALSLSRKWPPGSNPPAKNLGVNKGLVGSYVVLELNSGQRVQGVLEEKTGTHFKIQLPGMGPFEYPVSSVKSISSAQ